MNEDEKWMQIAINQALEGEEIGEVPVGAILVKNKEIVAKAFNQPISLKDASAHAEIQIIRAAGIKLNNYRLNNTTMYVTMEPCLMCMGAIIHARIERIVFGAYDTKLGACVSQRIMSNNKSNHNVNIQGGVLGKDCKNILNDFFKSKRKK
jgi:tRNA(adenine34) deaminase